MKGAVFLGDRIVELRDFPDAEAGPGEVVVQIRASGMCGSDLHAYRAAPADVYDPGGHVVGHEPAGVVHAVGPGVPSTLAAVGDRVMVHHYIGCGRCNDCRSGWPQMCVEVPFTALGTEANGGHAPFLVVPVSTLVPLRDDLSFEAGAAIGCGTGTAWGGLDRVGDIGGKTIVVFGQGPVGLSVTMLATARGAKVIAVDLSPSRRAEAARFGAVATIDPAERSASEAVMELTRGKGAYAALETSGATPAIDEALHSVARWGRVCLIGLGAAQVNFRVLDFYRHQITLMTSWTMSVVQQRTCADFIADSRLPVDELFTHRWRLDQVAEAYREFDLQQSGKGVILFDDLNESPGIN